MPTAVATLPPLTTTAPLPAAPGSPPPVVPPPLDPRREQVVVVGADIWGGYQAWASALPRAIDDVTADFGADLYARMQHDSTVNAGVQFLRTTSLAKPLTLNDAPGAPDPRLAAQVTAFCTRALAALPQPIEAVLYELSAAIADGWRAAECIVRADVWDGRPVWVYAAVKVKPNAALAPVRDRYGTHLGYRIGRDGLTVPQIGPVLAADPTFLPRDHFAHYAFRPAPGDPRGTSILRAIYHDWWLLQQLYPELLAWVAQYARATVVITVGPNVIEVPQADNADGTGSAGVDPVTDAVAKGKTVRGGGVLGLPNGYTAQFAQATGGETFIALVAQQKQAITHGILGATLATMEGQHMARAAAVTHQDTANVTPRYIKEGLCAVVEDDLLRPLVTWNYGPDVAALYTPEASLGTIETEDLAKNGAVWAQLWMATNADGVPFFDETQLPGLWAALGVPQSTLAPAARTARLAARQAAPSPAAPVTLPPQGVSA